MNEPDPHPARMVPPTSAAAVPFWEATRRRELVLQWCLSCDAPIHFPREACPDCLGDQLEFRAAEGSGTIYACSVMPRPANGTMAGREPYVVALIDLDEGVRTMSNVLVGPEVDPYSVQVGERVVVDWEPLGDGRHLPVFVLA